MNAPPGILIHAKRVTNTAARQAIIITPTELKYALSRGHPAKNTPVPAFIAINCLQSNIYSIYNKTGSSRLDPSCEHLRYM